MELYLQFGYGMMEHCRHLIRAWEGGTVVLSPRDLTGEQLARLGRDVCSIQRGETFLDPQFLLPHSDHERLCSHNYWPNEYDTEAFWQGPPLVRLLTDLLALNEEARTSAFLLPGLLATVVDDDWLESQRAVLEEAAALGTERPLYATVALSADATRSQDQIELLLEHVPNWNAAGFYVVCEHPNGDYLVDDPNWLANVLDLVAGLRLLGSKVILGYCNHQMLIASVAKVDAICSGTWMNVRSFPPGKFAAAYEEEIKQRRVWYYCPQAFSEYRIPFLDIAQRQGVLDAMAPPEELDGGYASQLFSGPQPSSVSFTEQAAFRHYLFSLHSQAGLSVHESFDEAVSAHETLLDQAEEVHDTLSVAGIRGQFRDFRNCFDANRAALSVFSATRGPVIRRRWSDL